MTAFWLYPLAVWQLTPRILHHLTQTLTKETPVPQTDTEHRPEQFYWDAETEHCPHKPIPERYSDAWDEWMTLGHQLYDDGVLCLSAPAMDGCPECTEDDGEMVPWSACRVRQHALPKDGVAPNPDAEHQPVTVLVGTVECLDRECAAYFTEDGDADPGVERCSHIREEQVCSCQRGDDGEYGDTACPARSHVTSGGSSS